MINSSMTKNLVRRTTIGVVNGIKLDQKSACSSGLAMGSGQKERDGRYNRLQRLPTRLCPHPFSYNDRHRNFPTDHRSSCGFRRAENKDLHYYHTFLIMSMELLPLILLALIPLCGAEIKVQVTRHFPCGTKAGTIFCYFSCLFHKTGPVEQSRNCRLQVRSFFSFLA